MTDYNELENSTFSNKWKVYTPSPRSLEKDIKWLNEHIHSKIVVSLEMLNQYNRYGFEQMAQESIDLFSSYRGLSICNHFDHFEIIKDRTHLEYLSIFGLVNYPYAECDPLTIDFSVFKNLKYLWLPIHSNPSHNFDFKNCKSLEHLFWPVGYKEEKSFFSSALGMPRLKTLSLFRSKFRTLDGINFLSKLEYLCVDYTKNLKDVSELAGCSSLTAVELQNCPNIEDLSCLRDIADLKILSLKRCPKIESLNFLKDSSLEYLDFYDSKIIDGDLSFLDTMKKLKVLRFDGKQHYNRRPKEFSHIPVVNVEATTAWDYYQLFHA